MALTKVKAGNILLTTPGASSNDVTPATTQYVTTALANLADSAPSTLNTLNELAAALGDDANFSTTVTNSIAAKLPLAGGTLTGSIIFDNNVQAIKIKDAAGTAGYVFYLDNADTLVVGNGTIVEKIRLDTSGNEGAITIDTNGNVGIGVTPDTFSSGYTALQLNGYAYNISHSGGDHYMTNNAYYNGGWKYGQTSTAQKVELASGRITLMTAASGSADAAITWNTGLVQDSSGKVGIGTTTLNKFFNLADPNQGGETLKLHFEASSSGDYWAIYPYDRTNGHYPKLHLGANENLKILNTGAIDMIDGALHVHQDAKVGIGTNAPVDLLHVTNGDRAIDTRIQLQSFGQLPIWHTKYAAGTQSSPTVATSGTELTRFAVSSWDGTDYSQSAAQIRVVASANHGNNSAPSYMAFDTNSTTRLATEKMRITSTGVVLAGTAISTSPPNYPGAFTSYRTAAASTTTEITWGFNASAGGNNKDYAYKASGSGDYAFGVLNANESTWMSRLGFDGRIYLTNTTVGSISDRRLKENIVAANSQWNDIKALQFKNYTWKNTERGTGTYLGLIADEVKAVSPNLVEVEYATKETLPENGIDPEYEGVKYSIVWMKAVKALQEAMTKIETLETKLEAAEARIETLEE